MTRTEFGEALAQRVTSGAGASERDRLDLAYQLCYGRSPTAEDAELLIAFLDWQEEKIRVSRVRQSANSRDRDRAAALVDCCHALLVANEFLFVE